MEKTGMTKRKRYPLDLIAVYHWAISKRGWTPMYRFTAVLAEDVKPDILADALDDVLPRFPYFLVKIKRGFLNPYFEAADITITPQDDGGVPFSRVKPDEPLLRVRYHARKLSVEMQHILADGYGAVVFLKTLLARYFALQGIVPHEQEEPCGFDLSGDPSPEEYEDSFPRFARASKLSIAGEPRAYHLNIRPAFDANHVLCTGTMDVGSVLEKARAYGASVTEYLSSVLAQAADAVREECKDPRALPVRISLTADLRRYFSTQTLRNFSQYANLGPDSIGGAPFEQTLSAMRGKIREAFSKESLLVKMGEQLGYIRFMRFMPAPMKRLLIMLVHLKMGDTAFTTNFSNLGVVTLPDTLARHVERMETYGSNFRSVKLECGAISFGSRMCVCFSSAGFDACVPEKFFSLLKRDGVTVDMETNAEEVRRSAMGFGEGAYAKAAAIGE